MQTFTIVYKLSVTNLEFTLGLIENANDDGKMSLRVENSSVSKSQGN